MPKMWFLLLFSRCILGFRFQQALTHTHRPSILLQHLLKHMGRAASSRISLAEKKEQSQDQFSSVNPEFPWDGVIGARKFAKQRKHKTLEGDSLQLLPCLCLNIKENSTAQTKHSSLSTYPHPYPDTTMIYVHLAVIRLFMLIISISKHWAYRVVKEPWKEGWMDLSL